MKKVTLWSSVLLSVLVLAVILASCSLMVAPAPKGLNATALSQSSIHLIWNSAEKSFTVYRSSSSNGNFAQVATVQSTSYVDTGLAPLTTYFYEVKAKNQYGLSSPSNVASATTLMASPKSPVLNVTAFSTNTISLSWSEGTPNVNNFMIYRTSGNSAFAHIATLPGNVMSYTDRNLTPATTYDYKLLATNEGGMSPFSNIIVQMTNGLPPTAPSNLSITSFSTDTISLSWINPKNISEIELYQSTGTTVKSTIIVKRISPTATIYAATGLIPSTIYSFKLRALNKWGYSDFSNIVSQMTKAFGSYFPIRTGQVDRVEISAGVPLVDTLGINPEQTAFEHFFNSIWMNSSLSKTTRPSSFTVNEDVIYTATQTSTNSTMLTYKIEIPEAYLGKPNKMESLYFDILKQNSTVIFNGVPLIDNANTGNASGTTLLKSSVGNVFERTSSYLSLSIGNKTYSDVLKVDLILNNLKRDFYFARNIGVIKLDNYLNQKNMWEFISGLTVVKPDIGKFEYNPAPAIAISPKITDLSTSTSITMTWSSTQTNVSYSLYLEKMGDWIQKIGSSTQTHFNFEKLPTGIYTWFVVTKNASGLSTASKASTFTVDMGNKVNLSNNTLESLVRSSLDLPNGPIYTSELSKITSLENNWPSSGMTLSNLNGIQYLTNLATLDLVGNDIKDLSPLRGLKNLRAIDMSYNKISDLTPLSTMTGLVMLKLSHNDITDITPIASLVNLTVLDLSYNKISDINAISNLRKLQMLDLSSNKIKDFTPLEGIGQSLLSLDLSYNSVPASQLGFIRSWTQLHNLGMSGFNLNNSEITFLSKFTNLESLDLGFNRISNITPLASLTGLQSLFLYSNMIKDISPLANLKNLQWLNAGANMISDLSPLSNLLKLRFLDLSLNRISDISPLTNLSNLEILNLNYNDITLKYAPSFDKMLHLLWLMLNSNAISDFNVISTAPDLWILDISSNNISSLSPISNMDNLLRIDFSSNKIKDMNAVVNDMNLPIGSIIDLKHNDLNLTQSSVINGINELTSRGIKVLYK